MNVYSQLPGTLNITLVRGDCFSIALSFGINLTGYSFSAAIQQGALTIPLTVKAIDAAKGEINISLIANCCNKMTAGTSTTWYFRWTEPSGMVRTILSGTVGVRK